MRALALLARRLVESKGLMSVEAAEIDGDSLVVRAEATRHVAVARYEAALSKRGAVLTAARAAEQEAEALLRLVSPELRAAWGDALSQWRSAASNVQDAESLAIGYDRRAITGRIAPPTTDAVARELRKDVETAQAKAAAAWQAVLEAAAAAPLAAVLATAPNVHR